MIEPPPVGLYIEGKRVQIYAVMQHLIEEGYAFRYSPRRKQIQVLLRSERSIRNIERFCAISHIYCSRRTYLH